VIDTHSRNAICPRFTPHTLYYTPQIRANAACLAGEFKSFSEIDIATKHQLSGVWQVGMGVRRILSRWIRMDGKSRQNI
jgi:hypothetical protein